MMHASKIFRNTPRKTPAKKLKPVHSQSQHMPQCMAKPAPVEERPRWVPPVEEDSDYEVPYIGHAVGPPSSAGLIAPGPHPSAPPLPPPNEWEEYEVEYTPLESPSCASSQSFPRDKWDATMHNPKAPPPLPQCEHRPLLHGASDTSKGIVT